MPAGLIAYIPVTTTWVMLFHLNRHLVFHERFAFGRFQKGIYRIDHCHPVAFEIAHDLPARIFGGAYCKRFHGLLVIYIETMGHTHLSSEGTLLKCPNAAVRPHENRRL